MVEIIPFVATFRILKLPASGINRFPAVSIPIRDPEEDRARDAEVAGPPSPPKQKHEPLPATVVIMPLIPTFRILPLPESVMYRFPAASKVRPVGYESCATFA